MGKGHGLGQLIVVKVDRLGPQTKGLAAQVDGISTVQDGGFQLF